MTWPISHAIWQTLRAVARSKRPVPGKDLRISWTRRTKDGTFLLELVDLGLLQVAGEKHPEPFDCYFTLTAAGKQAAEYGEYECDLNHVAIQPTQPTA